MWNSSQLPLWPCHPISSTHFISSGTWPRRSWIPWNLLLGCTVTLCGTRVRQFCLWELLVRQPMVSTWSSRKRFCAASTAAYRCVDTATFFSPLQAFPLFHIVIWEDLWKQHETAFKACKGWTGYNVQVHQQDKFSFPIFLLRLLQVDRIVRECLSLWGKFGSIFQYEWQSRIDFINFWIPGAQHGSMAMLRCLNATPTD